MRLKLSLVSGTEVDDIVVTVDSTATAGEVAERLRASHPRPQTWVRAGADLTLRVHPTGRRERVVRPDTPMHEAGVRSGDTITLTNGDPSTPSSTAAATLTLLAGPDAGTSFPLVLGTTIVGRSRDCDVRLSDPLVSKRHARINVSDLVEVIDDNSANGVHVAGEPTQRAVIRATDRVRIGDTEFTVQLHRGAAGLDVLGGSLVEFNRSPRLDPFYAGIKLVAPEPPGPPEPHRFPWISILAPLLMGVLLYAVTRSLLSMLFIGLTPIMLVGSYFEGRFATKRATEQKAAAFRAALRDLAVQLQYACDLERTQRRKSHPSTDEVVEAIRDLTPLVWTRRPEHQSFGQVRLGLGTQPSRNTVEMPTTNNAIPELWRELHDVVGRFELVDRVPVVADLSESANVGVAGPTAAAHPLAAAIVAQLVGLHSPAEVVLAAITSPGSMDRWTWLKWLPHAGSDFSPIASEHLVSSQKQAAELTTALEDLVAARLAAAVDSDERVLPLVVVLVEDEAVVERARLVQVAERGGRVGVHLVWCASSLQRLPAACRAYVEVDPHTGQAVAGFVHSGTSVDDLEAEPISTEDAHSIGRRLAPVVDAGALLDDQSDLPRSISLITLTGPDLARQPSEVIDHWRGNHSLPPVPDEPKLRRDANLRALVGQAALDRQYLDLRFHGPHALVGGTTGAGKSEFLQSWILGLAMAHSPARVNFLFVDYKGGAAFAECVDLPHCVGLVTDLSPHLVRRALRSLNAELRRREHILNRKKAKDLLELERRRDPECPPSLVIVVDEFAALVGEVPEFVDGVVNVAQRGRSLGLHLILATQRPAGVIRDNLRANTNLRIALRMADDDDSTDVIGAPLAGSFDPSVPGRAAVKTGPGRLVTFQSAYVGGFTTEQAPPPEIDVREFAFGVGRSWDLPDSAMAPTPEPTGPTDISRIVETIRRANDEAAIAPVRQPWLPVLSSTFRLEALPSARNDSALVFGVADRPDEQEQPVVAFEPDRDGNMAVYGTGGSGKSTFLRTIAIAAGFARARGGPCHVYALDFGSRGLAMLEVLPHVGAVIHGDDTERTLRVLKMLRSMIDERAERYSAVNAATIVEYRERSGRADEPRVLLLVDNFAAFRSQYEVSVSSRVYELLESIAADGRSVGIHVLCSADKTSSLTASLQSVVQARLALRLSTEFDLTSLRVPLDLFDDLSPPGRGYMDDAEVQVAVFGGDPNVSRQASELQRLVEAMHRAGVDVAPPVERLADLIPASSVAASVGDSPVLGVWDETLEPLSFDPRGVFIVAGPPQSGKTTTVVTMLQGLDRIGPSRSTVLVAGRRSPLLGVRKWMQVFDPLDGLDDAAAELATRVRADDGASDLVVVIDNVEDVIGSAAEDEITDLLKAIRARSAFAIVVGEVPAFNGSWGLMATVKADRQGIVLQPDQNDGDMVVNTDFPRVQRAEFPAGRGLYARSGRVHRVQVLRPEMASATG